MDEMNKNNIRKPVAKSGVTKNTDNASVPSAENNASGDINIFSAVYQQQKKENEEKKQEITTVSDNTAKDKEKKKFNTIFIILIIITVVLFIASCVYLAIGAFKDDSPSVVDNNDLNENTVSASIASPFDFQQIYPVDFPEGIKEEYKDLYAQNQDFVGWLTVPGTSIDTPVYKANNDYYLKHDNYDTYTKYGVPFLDMYCDVDTLCKNTTIYGHNFDNGLIFDDLHKYQDLEFFKENPVIEFNTLYKDYKWKVIAAFHTNGTSTGDNDYLFYYVAAYMGNNSFMELYDELQQRSYIHTGVDVQPTDKILTLSTCTYFFDKNGRTENARFAVVARLVREGESEEVDVSLATENENVRYPQLYYDVFGGTNPYRNASKWEASND